MGKNKKTSAGSFQYKRYSKTAEVWHRMKKNKAAMAGLVILAVLAFIAIFADVLWDYDTQVIGQNMAERLQGPSASHFFGTDEFGRDIFCRMMYGTRYSLCVGLVSVFIAFAGGLLLGAIAGYYGGIVDDVIMRISDVFNTIPTILMGIVIVSVMGTSLLNLMLAIGITSIPVFVRSTRAAVLTVCSSDYVESAKAVGLTEKEIIFKHVVPNCLSPIIVSVTLHVGRAIISASSLSYLGLGAPAPSPEWGSMLNAGKGFIRNYSYMTLFPGLMILITVVAFNMVGDALRDALDPKLKQ